MNEPTLVPCGDEMNTLNLEIEENKKELKIVNNKELEDMIQLLKEFIDVFSRGYDDMLGLDPQIVTHKIPLIPGIVLVKQKLRRMNPNTLLKVRDKIKKQYDARFLEVVKYPEWVANVIPVMKKDGRVRVCVDYRDLNKASLKDDFSLLHIDVLVDNAAGLGRCSCIDKASGYNQILMDKDDKEKTAFITQWGVFCYWVMPFRLKNAGATYNVPWPHYSMT